jgi:RimJ/RimL family protein N-acetyltransferase
MAPIHDGGVQLVGPDPLATNVYSLSTARLSLEIPEPDDAPVLFSLVGGPDREEVTAGLVWDGPDDVSETSDWIDRCRDTAFGESGFHWVIRDVSGDLTGTAGHAMGIIGTRPLGTPGRADVGYWLGRPYWGRGIMSEVLTSLLRFGFDELAFGKIEAEVFVSNDRGIRLVESVGMRREGVIRRRLRKRGLWVDEAIYGMLPEESPVA